MTAPAGIALRAELGSEEPGRRRGLLFWHRHSALPRRRALVLTEAFPPARGGEARWFYELYRRLPREDFFTVTAQRPGAHAFDRDSAGGLEIRRLPLSSPHWDRPGFRALGYYFRTFRILRRIVLEQRVGVIHCGRSMPEGLFGWLFLRLYGIPYLCYIHGEDLLHASRTRFLARWAQRALAGAALIIANSRSTADRLQGTWDLRGSVIEVLHPGMDGEKFTPDLPDSTFLNRLGWSGRTVVLTVGELRRRKGQDMMIRALPAIARDFPEVLYAIVGEGEERERLEGLVDELRLHNYVQFLSVLEDGDTIRCYQQCSLFALPNRTEGRDMEGFGIVLAEAQGCGKPVLAGDSGGTREAMRVGETGMIADCRTPESLAAAVRHLLSRRDRLPVMGELARQHACAELDWPVHVKRARELFALVRAL